MDATAALLSCVSVLFFTCPYGFAVVATIRVGNLLGAGQTEQAKLTSKPFACQYWAAAFVGCGSYLNVLIK